MNQFTRCPALLIAAARRLALIMCGHYVDDNFILELTCLSGHAHSAFRELASLMGIALSADKRQMPSATQSVWTGNRDTKRPDRNP